MPDLRGVVVQIISLINYIIPVLITAALVLFFWGIVRFVYNTSDPHAKSTDKQILVWGLIAMFVLTSVWGLVRLLCSSVLGADDCSVMSGTTGVPYQYINNQGAFSNDPVPPEFQNPWNR